MSSIRWPKAESQTRTSGDASDAQYVVASQVDAVSAQVQLVLNSLEAVLSSSDVSDRPANSLSKHLSTHTGVRGPL